MNRIGLFAADLLLVAVGVFSVGISVMSLLAPPTTVTALAQVLSIMLAALGLLLVAAVVERRARLDKLNKKFDDFLSQLEPESKYLPDMKSVRDALHAIVSTCSGTIYSIGALSSDRSYLNAISDAVKERDVVYYRVVIGNHIYHPMHLHLLSLLGNGSTYIGWLEREKYGNITVTDKGAVLAFPSPRVDRLTGLSLSVKVATPYGQQVLNAYHAAAPVTEGKLAELCEKCRSEGLRGSSGRSRD